MTRTHAWAVGAPVKIISHDPDDYMPPIGTVGTILTPMDDEGDFDVLFAGHPCPNLPGSYWCVPKCQLAPAILADSEHIELSAVVVG